jgi:hypothetical protein
MGGVTDIVASGTILLNTLIGYLFQYIVAVLPMILELAAISFVVYVIFRILKYFHIIR